MTTECKFDSVKFVWRLGSDLVWRQSCMATEW